MKRHKAFTFIALFLVLFGTVGAALAMTSPSFNLVKNTNEGGLVGGEISSSASYRLVSTIGGAIQVSSTSPSYRMCTGFVCGLSELFIRKIFLPFVLRIGP